MKAVMDYLARPIAATIVFILYAIIVFIKRRADKTRINDAPNWVKPSILVACLLLIVMAIFATVKSSNNNTKVQDNIPTVSAVSSESAILTPDMIDQTQLLKLTNKDREAAGLSDVSLDADLNASAVDKCNDMVTKNYWSHDAPDGTTFWSFIKKHTQYQLVGENLSYGYLSAKDVNIGWMGSPEHKANILNRDFNDIGFSVCKSPNYIGHGQSLVVVEHFIQSP